MTAKPSAFSTDLLARLTSIEERLTALENPPKRPRGRPPGTPLLLDVPKDFEASVTRLALAQTESFKIEDVAPRAQKASQMRAAQVLRSLGFRRERVAMGNDRVWFWTNDALLARDQECPAH